MKLTGQQKFEALKLRYKDQVELLRFMTKLDFQIFGGYTTLQLALGSWLSQHTIAVPLAKVGILLVDLALALIAGILLYNDFRRRKEVVSTIKNINAALGYSEPNVYLEGKVLNAETAFRPWAHFYILGVIVCFLGIILLIFKAV